MSLLPNKAFSWRYEIQRLGEVKLLNVRYNYHKIYEKIMETAKSNNSQ